MNTVVHLRDPNSFDVDGPLKVLVVYGSRRLLEKEDVASIYSCHDQSQLASLLNAIAIDMTKSREITQIIFLDDTLMKRYSVDEAIERGSIDLPVEWTDEYCVSYRLV